MSPRALTEQEKQMHKDRIIEIAETLVMANGMKNVSVDDIVNAAGIAKGSFYQHFHCKEDLLLALLWKVYRRFLAQAETVIEKSTPKNLESSIRNLIRGILSETSGAFFFANHQELEYLIEVTEEHELKNFNELELEAFHRLIVLAKLDPKLVDPAVVHNYMHTMYFASIDEAIMRDRLHETIEALLDGLMYYMFKRI